MQCNHKHHIYYQEGPNNSKKITPQVKMNHIVNSGLLSPKSPSVEPTTVSESEARSTHTNGYYPSTEAIDNMGPLPNGETSTGFPTTIPYNAAFDDSLMSTMLYIPSSFQQRPNGEQPLDATSITPEHLPIPLLSHLRTHPSGVPGVALTHPHGSLYGGPQPHSLEALHAYAQELIASNGIVCRSELEALIEREIVDARSELEERLDARRSARERNQDVEREIRKLVDEREMEIRVAERWRNERDRQRGKD
jgi:hypothetical protein